MKRILFLLIASIGCITTSLSAENYSQLTSCTSCHGKTFEKKALGRSNIVKDMTEEQIKNALQGYKDGTYGGPMKGIMKAQVMRLKNIPETAKTISDNVGSKTKLKKLPLEDGKTCSEIKTFKNKKCGSGKCGSGKCGSKKCASGKCGNS